MKLLKKENGHTLIELVIVLALLGVILMFLWNSYLSIHRTYIRGDKKAQNLEEARLIINHITDNFQSYEKCRVWVEDNTGADIVLNKPVATPPTLVVDGDGFTNVKAIIFTDDPVALPAIPVLPDPAEIIDPLNPQKTVKMSYVQTAVAAPAIPGPPLVPAVLSEGTLTWHNKAAVEIDSQISSFKVRQTGDLLDFKIEVLQKGHGVVADQLLEVETTLNLKYKPKD